MLLRLDETGLPGGVGSFKLQNEAQQVIRAASLAKVLFGTDSHTCNAGAFGQFATGIGNTDASFVMGTGKLLIKSPASMQFALEGEMPDHLLAKVHLYLSVRMSNGERCVTQFAVSKFCGI